MQLFGSIGHRVKEKASTFIICTRPDEKDGLDEATNFARIGPRIRRLFKLLELYYFIGSDGGNCYCQKEQSVTRLLLCSYPYNIAYFTQELF